MSAVKWKAVAYSPLDRHETAWTRGTPASRSEEAGTQLIGTSRGPITVRYLSAKGGPQLVPNMVGITSAATSPCEGRLGKNLAEASVIEEIDEDMSLAPAVTTVQKPLRDRQGSWPAPIDDRPGKMM